jgi:hypothetical protein
MEESMLMRGVVNGSVHQVLLARGNGSNKKQDKYGRGPDVKCG